MNDSERRSFSLKLPDDELRFLGELRRELNVTALGEALRQLTAAARTLFHVPPYMVGALRGDIARRRLTLITYLQELLARRYEELVGSPASASAPAAPGARSATILEAPVPESREVAP